MRGSSAEPVCDTMDGPSLPARRPNAEAEARPVRNLLGVDARRPVNFLSLVLLITLRRVRFSSAVNDA